MENPSSPSPEASQGGSLRGRFSEATDEFVQVFTASIDFDRRLYKEDIAGSIAHATMLETIGVLSQTEKDQILSGLNTVLAEIENGDMQWRVDLED
ncbi:MAG: argininosuccinate lyase, partial [Gammaproteobacteria bacterium]